MKGVLLAGGTGSRLRPITHTGSKHLIPVANKPVLEYAVEDLRDAGITEIGVILGHKSREEIRNLLGDGSEYGVDITYILQGEPLGLAHAAGCAESFVDGESFVMYLGDNMLNSGIEAMVASFERGAHDAGIALQRVDDPTAFGVADLDDDGNVVELVEKPDNPPSDLALIGIYVFSPAVFDAIDRLEPSWRGELEITDAIQLLLEDGYSIDSHIVEGWWKDTGRPEDILEANQLVLDNIERTIAGDVEDATVSGSVDLAEGAVVADGAVVRGPATIAAGTVVSKGAYVGPYTAIGPDSTIENTHIENSVVIGDADITTTGRIVDSLIGAATTIDNAETLVPEGRRLVVGENSNLKL